MKKTIPVLSLAGLMAELINYSYGSGTLSLSGSGGNGNSGQRILSLYDQGMEATRSLNFHLSMKLFDQALKEDPTKPRNSQHAGLQPEEGGQTRRGYREL